MRTVDALVASLVQGQVSVRKLQSQTGFCEECFPGDDVLARRLWKAAAALEDRSEPVTPENLVLQIGSSFFPHVFMLTQQPCAQNPEKLAIALQEEFARKKLVDSFKTVLHALQNPTESLDEVDNVLQETAKITRTLVAHKEPLHSVTAFDLLGQEERPNQVIPTGFDVLDAVVGFLRLGSLSIVGALPGTGKTSLIVQIITSLGDRNIPTHFFSLEMPLVDIARYQMRMLTGLPAAGTMNEEQLEKMEKTLSISSLSQPPSGGLEAIVAQVRRLHGEHGIQVFFIDHLQRICVSTGQKNFTSEQHHSLIADTLADLAKELDIAIVAASQLARRVNSGAPAMTDLKGSGAYEANAASILLLRKKQDYVEAILAKNRYGPKLGSFMLKRDLKYLSFSEASDFSSQ